jgi:hypothetical protein
MISLRPPLAIRAKMDELLITEECRMTNDEARSGSDPPTALIRALCFGIPSSFVFRR